jgi:hypothetical protein
MAKRTSTIHITKSARGTTIRATGRGALELFNVLTRAVSVRKLQEEAPTRDNESVFMALQLVGGTEAITEDLVESWSDIEARDAQQWALSAHLNASDHDDVTVLPVPYCVRRHMKSGGA